MITPIDKLQSILPSGRTEASSTVETGSGSSVFGAVFQSAIQNVRDTDAAKTEAQYLLATGQLDNPAALMIAGAKSQAAIDLLIQLRNKAVESYSELTRMNL